jgi:hypothetical protein
MTKKDRKALVFSIMYLLWDIALFLTKEPVIGLIWIGPLVGYWGYRFIKGDISFLKIKMED